MSFDKENQLSRNLKLERQASKIAPMEGAAMNELINRIIKGDDPVEIIKFARTIEKDDVQLPGMKHVLGYVAGMTTGWAKDNPEQAVKEFRWELGYALMELAYGEQDFQITPMERLTIDH